MSQMIEAFRGGSSGRGGSIGRSGGSSFRSGSVGRVGSVGSVGRVGRVGSVGSRSIGRPAGFTMTSRSGSIPSFRTGTRSGSWNGRRGTVSNNLGRRVSSRDKYRRHPRYYNKNFYDWYGGSYRYPSWWGWWPGYYDWWPFYTYPVDYEYPVVYGDNYYDDNYYGDDGLDQAVITSIPVGSVAEEEEMRQEEAFGKIQKSNITMFMVVLILLLLLIYVLL